MSVLKKTVELVIKNNNYTVTYPNTGQQIDIELLKAKISDSNYDLLRFSHNPLFQEQANKIDMIATFNILIPQLKTDLNARSIFDLSEVESDELVDVYTQQYMPWYIPIKEAIKNPKETATTKENDKDEK